MYLRQKANRVWWWGVSHINFDAYDMCNEQNAVWTCESSPPDLALSKYTGNKPQIVEKFFCPLTELNRRSFVCPLRPNEEYSPCLEARFHMWSCLNRESAVIPLPLELRFGQRTYSFQPVTIIPTTHRRGGSRSHSSNGGAGVRHLNRDVPALLQWILPIDLAVLIGEVAEDGKPSGGEVGQLAEADGAVGEKVENIRALHQRPGGGGSRSGERCAGEQS